MGTIFLKAQTLTGCSPVFIGIVPKVPGIFQNGTFLLFLMISPKHPLSHERRRPQTSYPQNCFFASFGLQQASQRNSCLGYKVSNLGQWEKVALFPSDFITKNQLAREGSQSVSLVTIPALTTIVDRQFKEDRTLCPVWALRYYLDRTKDLRGSRSLLFISFKKGQASDIRPATLFLVKTNHPTLL